MVRFPKPKSIQPFNHSVQRLQGGGIERDNPMASFVLAAPNNDNFSDQISVASTQVLHLDRGFSGFDVHAQIGHDCAHIGCEGGY